MQPDELQGPLWLLRDGEVLAAADVARSYPARLRGLLGKRGYDGALIVPHIPVVHSMGMRFAMDVAFLDRELTVIDAVHVAPWRVTRPRWGCRWVLQAESGAFERWHLHAGDQLELHCVP